VLRLLTALLTAPLAAPLALCGVRFLTVMLSRVGHLALEPAVWILSGRLGWRPRFRGVILARPEETANWHLLTYWAEHLTVVSRPWLVGLLRAVARNPLVQHDSYEAELPGGAGRHIIVPAIYGIQAAYQRRFGSDPLLRPREDDRHRAREALERCGADPDSWWITLHVREAHDGRATSRNSDIEAYLTAVSAVTARGGIVIRIGAPSMKRLPPMPGVIDDAHSETRSDVMDVVWLSQSRFFLGSNSGPLNVCYAFGVPCVVPNFAPMGHGAYTGRDLFIPKLYVRLRDGKALTFAEVLRSPLRRLYGPGEFAAAGLTLVDNTPEEIHDLVTEMMDRLDGTFTTTADDDRRQERFHALLAEDPLYATSSHVGRDFLRDHAALLEMGRADAPRERGHRATTKVLQRR